MEVLANVLLHQCHDQIIRYASIYMIDSSLQITSGFRQQADVSYLQLKGSFYPTISHWSPVFFFSDAQSFARYQTPKLGHALSSAVNPFLAQVHTEYLAVTSFDRPIS